MPPEDSANRKLQSFKELVVWQKAIDLSEAIYRITAEFPREEVYGLTSQMRRAAVSIPSNIAEGHGRNSRGELIQFLGHSRGSLGELEIQIIIAQRLGYVSQVSVSNIMQLVDEVGRLINGFRRALAKPKG
jgi:four helix bundle protein